MPGDPPVPTLSIFVPVYNERATIEALLAKVLAVPFPIEREVLVGDDGSSDGTRDLLDAMRGTPGLRIEFMPENVGRGGVLKHLWTLARGDIFVHQDADLEYEPAELPRLLAPILANDADVVYGSRFKGRVERMRWANGVGNRVLTLACRTLYGLRVSDLMTCYKMYRSALVRDLVVDANGFDFEAELTARFAQRGARFVEVPVSFVGRTVEEGKKIRAVDAIHVTRRLVACRWTEGTRE